MPRTNDASRGRGAAPAPAITSAMMALAWSIIHVPFDSPEAGRMLARLILDAGEDQLAAGP